MQRGLLAYGISRDRYKKRSASSQIIGSENKKSKSLRRRGGTLDKAVVHSVVVNLSMIRQAKKIADKLPHGDGHSNVHQIQLPYSNTQNHDTYLTVEVQAYIA